MLSLYNNFDGIAPGDIVIRKATSNGQVITALSMNPLTDDTESNITLDVPVTQPAAVEFEASMSQRVRHDFATVCLFANESTGSRSIPNDIQINTIYQSSATNGAAYNAVAGTTLTIVLNSPFQGYLSDWIHVYGLVDNRLNYPNLAVNFISYDRLTITAAFSDEAALPSLAATYSPAAGTTFIKHYNNLGGAVNGFGMRFTSSTPTSAALVSVFGGNDVQISGSLVGDHRTTIGTTNPIYNAGVNGQVEIRATTRYRLEGRPAEASFLDKTADSIGTPFTPRLSRTSVKPAVQSELRPRFRAYCPKSMTRPIAKITSISKAGTTTATVNTASPHGLVTGNYVTIKGVRDQTNFANFATPVTVTVINATQFQVVMGTAVTATSYGGAVILTNGGIDQQGLLAQVVQNAQVILGNATTPDQLILTGSAAWSTGVGVMNIGDYVEVYGVRDNTTGADLGVDGTWEVAMISTTALTLIPVTDVFGVRKSPVVTTINTAGGGIVLHRTTLRAHDLTVEQWDESKVMIDGQGTLRVDKALPVYPVGGTQAVSGSVTVSGTVTSNAGTSAAAGSGWKVQPDSLLVNDIASAAITTTTTTAAITPATAAGASEFNIIVTAVSGTTPTMDVGIEESDDSGTNWYRIYDFPRITATGSYRTPMLPLTGNRLRYVQTIAGTTPSFTRSLNRITNVNVGVTPFRQIIDRAVVTTTLNATTATLKTNGATRLQMVVNMGAVTTAPVFQLEGSDDNGATWYSIGTTLTSVASSTVQLTVVDFNAELIRARVSTAGTGSSLGANGVLLKAFGN